MIRKRGGSYLMLLIPKQSVCQPLTRFGWWPYYTKTSHRVRNCHAMQTLLRERPHFLGASVHCPHCTALRGRRPPAREKAARPVGQSREGYRGCWPGRQAAGRPGLKNCDGGSFSSLRLQSHSVPFRPPCGERLWCFFRAKKENFFWTSKFGNFWKEAREHDIVFKELVFRIVICDSLLCTHYTRTNRVCVTFV